MNERLTLSVEAVEPALLPGIVAAISTLPRSYELVDGPADVVVIDGRNDWIPRISAAVEDGAKATVVVEPRAGTPDHGGLIQRLQVPVVLDTLWRHSPMVDRVADAFQQAAAPGALLEAGGVVGENVPLADAILALEFTASALLRGPTLVVEDVIDTATSVTVLGSVDESLFRLTAVFGATTSTTARFRIVSAEQTVEAEIHGPGSARAATGSITTAAGRTELPTAFESTRRSALRLAWTAVQQGRAVDDLDRLASLTGLRTP